ncbi:YbaK/prolyl-tRNA synthetase associated domain-containing protein [Candidatus Uhrbacteria bacterium]|nr:YbaK/prolyl-tRNA synthetase associated domain-containing protein [Candidatus Uhrbacteria bacterium]
MSQSVFDQIRSLLDHAAVPYDCRAHAPVYTSQEAADVRGVALAQGAKSLVLHVDQSRYLLAVLSAAKQADFEKLRAHLGAKKVALATPEEVQAQTGCTIGSVPPFGSMLGMPMVVDPSLAAQQMIAFNPGSHVHSILMPYTAYAELVQPELVAFARP